MYILPEGEVVLVDERKGISPERMQKANPMNMGILMSQFELCQILPLL